MDHVKNETVDGLIASQLNGRVTRRQLATGVLAIPAITALIAACGGDDEGSQTTTAGGTGDTTAPSEDTAAAGVPGGIIKVAIQKPAGALDPVAMQDLGSYGIVAQSFEYLAGLGDNDIGPSLATEWTPNADGSEWTFKLREGVKWQNGADFTADDVAATLDRMVVAENAGLKGIIDMGSVTAPDPLTAVVKLISANGNFPYLVSLYNPQSCITPKDYVAGTTSDGQPDGTGPWILESYDPNTGAKFKRNDAWWGPKTPLDGVDWQFFNDTGTMVTAVQGGAVDAIVQFQVIGGDALFNDSNFNVLGLRATTHRQIWMRVDEGQFADKKVRQAFALSIDRPALVEALFRGKADVGNDHVIAPVYPYFDAAQPQRERDTEKAKALLAEAGFPDGLKATLHAGDLQEIPQLAELLQVQVKEGGFDLEIAVESLDTFYGAQWCPAEPAQPPCSGAAELGIVDYGHRSTPDVYLNAALKTEGIWNSSQYASTEFDAAFAEFQQAVGVDQQKAAAAKIQAILTEDVPVVVPYFYNYLAGHSKKFTNVRVSAIGQMFLETSAQA